MSRFLLFLLVIGTFIYGFQNLDKIPVLKEISDGLIISKTTHTAKRTIDVLFIGNSYTFVNDLPKMLADVASSDPGNEIIFKISSVTQGGAHLIDMWNAGAAVAKIKSRHWDYVVLQDQSQWAFFPHDVKTATDAGAKFAGIIKQSGGIPVLYLTWPRQPGSAWYTNHDTSFMKSPDYMQVYLHYYTYALAKYIQASVVPVGDVWLKALKINPSLHLYQADGSHPSEGGTYLAALLFYQQFSGNNASKVEFVPNGANATEIAYIKNMAVAYRQ